MRAFLLFCTSLLFLTTGYAGNEQFNVAWHGYEVNAEGIGISGYDPVSYFRGEPEKGTSRYSAIHKGVAYRFASRENMRRFLVNPHKYEPAFGGWCALGLHRGAKITPDPLAYRIMQGKLVLFYRTHRTDARKLWEAQVALVGEERLMQEVLTLWEKNLWKG